MAYRQYIGARYVPLYAGDWDGTRNYEPLTIVTDANGNSYTSLKDVPAGTQLNNRDYWILTSSFSGAVEMLQRRMNTAEESITTLQGNVRDVTENVNQINGEVTQINSEITQIENKIAPLTMKRKYVIIGDSYLVLPDAQNFGKKLVSIMGLSSDDYYMLASDGGGFTVSGQSGSFEKLIRGLTADDSTITDIVVCGGANDRNATTQNLVAAINSFINYVKGRFVNARVWLSIVSACDIIGEEKKIINISYRSFLSACAGSAIFIPSGVQCLMFKSEMSDYLHPSAAGADMIAECLATELVNGEYKKCKTIQLNSLPVALSGFSVARNVNATYSQFGDNVNVLIGDDTALITLLNSSGASITQVWTKILDATDVPIGSQYFESTVVCILKTNNVYEYVPMSLRLTADGLYMKSTVNASNVTEIRFAQAIFSQSAF